MKLINGIGRIKLDARDVVALADSLIRHQICHVPQVKNLAENILRQATDLGEYLEEIQRPIICGGCGEELFYPDRICRRCRAEDRMVTL
jgi:hypothetical protein